jgi:DNA-binding response OmpR family regulator
MLSGHSDRWRVIEAARIGASDYVLKPVSAKALHDRIVAIIGRTRPAMSPQPSSAGARGAARLPAGRAWVAN